MSDQGTTAELLRKVRGIRIRTRRMVRDLLAGPYRSAFRGRGIEFDEVRGYVEGDDVRDIDWNVTARTGGLHVKVFREERERTVLLLVDVSGSTKFGSGEKTKAGLAAEVCAVLALAASGSQDRVGLIAFSDRIERLVPPRRGARHSLRVIRDVLSLRSVPRGTDIALALDRLARLRVKNAVVFLVSDFEDRGFERPFRVAARRHDLAALRIVDPREEELPSAGLLSLNDPERGRKIIADTDARSVRERFAEAARERGAALRALCAGAGVDLLELRTTDSFAASLRVFMERRGRRFGR